MLTVVVPATNRQIVTLAAVKAEFEVTGTSDDAFLTTLIDQASAAIEAWCNRVFASERVRETIDQSADTDSLMVSRFPVTEIFSLTIAGTDTDVATIETEDGGFLFRTTDAARTTWPCGRTVVEYQAGFALPGDTSPTLPKDISRAATILVKQAYLSRSRDPLIRSEESSGVGSTTYGLGGLDSGYDLPPEVEGLLCRYQITAGF